MYNDVYGYPAPPLHQTSSSNIVNLLNEAHKSISRSSQILNLSHQARQLGQPGTGTGTGLVTTPLSGRIVSSYPTLHGVGVGSGGIGIGGGGGVGICGGDLSPPYLNDNLLQMSTSFSSQPNMYFQPSQAQQLPTQLTAAQSAAAAAARLRPAYSVSNLMATGGYPASCKYGATGYANHHPYQSDYTSGYAAGLGLGPNLGSTLALGGGGLGSGLGSSGLAAAAAAAAQRHHLMSHSLHASNPAISQYYQHHSLPPSVYNLHQQFAGTQQQQYGGGGQGAHHHHQPLTHSNIQASVQQQMNPQYQYHVHQHQNHLQTHPLAALANTSGPFGGTLASSARDAAIAAVGGGGGGSLGLGLGTTGIGYEGLPHHHAASSHHPHSHTHSHHHLPSGLTYPHSHHHQLQQQQHQQHQQQHHHHHHLPYSKLDLDYPKLPQEHKRQVSFKFDVDQLSLDS